MRQNAANEAGNLLDEVNVLRARARTDRHAFRFPLLFFGGFTLATAPLYVIDFELRESPEGTFTWPFGEWIDMVWLAGLVAGAGLTVWWYRRHGHRAGIQTSPRNPTIIWSTAGAAPLVWTLLPLVGFLLWPFFIRDTFGLLASALGLIALARAERSRHLWIVTALYTATAVPAVVYDVQNQYHRLFHLFGVSPQEMPYGLLQGSPVLLPAMILLVGGLTVRRKTHP
ncbi:hypothetical protein ABT340_20595 [Streptosporangium sp. NPDC000239]|uniref:hypothetical protein n=1 Tax=Streptosporangium sp. NPDC000239 TaxID=3154248 RepID=UPI00332F2396